MIIQKRSAEKEGFNQLEYNTELKNVKRKIASFLGESDTKVSDKQLKSTMAFQALEFSNGSSRPGTLGQTNTGYEGDFVGSEKPVIDTLKDWYRIHVKDKDQRERRYISRIYQALECPDEADLVTLQELSYLAGIFRSRARAIREKGGGVAQKFRENTYRQLSAASPVLNPKSGLLEGCIVPILTHIPTNELAFTPSREIIDPNDYAHPGNFVKEVTNLGGDPELRNLLKKLDSKL